MRRERMPRLQDSPQVIFSGSALEAAARAPAAATSAASAPTGVVRVRAGEREGTLARRGPDASLHGNRL